MTCEVHLEIQNYTQSVCYELVNYIHCQSPNQAANFEANANVAISARTKLGNFEVEMFDVANYIVHATHKNKLISELWIVFSKSFLENCIILQLILYSKLLNFPMNFVACWSKVKFFYRNNHYIVLLRL